MSNKCANPLCTAPKKGVYPTCSRMCRNAIAIANGQFKKCAAEGCSKKIFITGYNTCSQTCREKVAAKGLCVECGASVIDATLGICSITKTCGDVCLQKVFRRHDEIYTIMRNHIDGLKEELKATKSELSNQRAINTFMLDEHRRGRSPESRYRPERSPERRRGRSPETRYRPERSPERQRSRSRSRSSERKRRHDYYHSAPTKFDTGSDDVKHGAVKRHASESGYLGAQSEPHMYGHGGSAVASSGPSVVRTSHADNVSLSDRTMNDMLYNNLDNWLAFMKNVPG
jgi:hypothetical protein